MTEPLWQFKVGRLPDNIFGFEAPLGNFKRWIGAKIKTRDGRRVMRQRDIPTTPAGAAYAERFFGEHSDSDLYFTPCYFKHKKGARRTAGEAHTVEWLWLDLDGVDGARTGGEAWAKFADALDDLHIPQPNIMYCTSENPADPAYRPHLQAYWRLDPVHVLNERGRRAWRRVARALAGKLLAAGFSVDLAASTNLVGFMRLPGSVHTKTGTRVYKVGPTHSRVYELSELREAVEPERPRPKRVSTGRTPAGAKKGRMLDLPQLKILSKGVPGGTRNLALYSLTKAHFADRIPFPEAVERCLTWNERCNPPEDPDKVRDVVARCYGIIGPQSEPQNFTGLDPVITAEIVSAVTGQVVQPDIRIRLWFPHPTERRACWTPTAVRQKREIVQKALAKRRIGRPRNKLPTWVRIGDAAVRLLQDGQVITNKAIAQIAGVSEATVKRHADTIRAYIQTSNPINLIKVSQGYKVMKRQPSPHKKPQQISGVSEIKPPPTITWSYGVINKASEGSCGGRGPPRPLLPEKKVTKKLQLLRIAR